MVVVFAVLVGVGLRFMGVMFGKENSDVFTATLPDAGGVAKGAKLLMSGVKIGTVTKVELDEKDQAKLTLSIDKGVKLLKGASLKIPSSLLSLGENPLMVMQGPGPERMVPGTDTLIGAKSTILQSSMPEVENTLKKVDETLDTMKSLMASIQKVVENQDRLAKVDRLLDSLGNTVDKFGSVADRVTTVIGSNQGNLTGALNSFRLAMKDIQSTTQTVAKMVKGGNYDEKVTAILANLSTTTENAGKLVDDLRAFVNDPNLREPLNKTAQNVATITESGTRIAADTEKMAANGVQITEKLNTFTEKANDLADSAKDALGSLKKILGKTPSTDKLNVTANLDLMHEAKPSRYRTDIEVGFNVGQNRIHAGLFDAFETNKITVQAGQPFHGGKGEIRYGIYASKPGLGVEYEIARGFALRGDVFDINNPRADLRARIDLGGGFYGWLGASQLFKRNALTVGVGFRK